MFSLEIRDLSLQLKLGCTPGERQARQEVRLSLELNFEAPPRALTSDLLSDTYCYADLCEALKKDLERTEPQTIERLSEHALEILREHLGNGLSGVLKIHKVKPPIEGLLGGVVLTRSFP